MSEIKVSYAELKKLDKPQSGWISKNINSPLSYVISLICIKLRLSANQVTLFSLIVALFSCFLMTQSRSRFCVIISGGLWYFFSIVDHADGVVARFNKQQSYRGGWLDSIVGHVSYALMLVCVSFGMYGLTHQFIYFYILFFCAGFLALAMVPLYCWMIRMRESSTESYNQLLQKPVKTRINFLTRLLIGLKYYAKGQFTRLIVFALALVGCYPLIYGFFMLWALLVALGILLTIKIRPSAPCF